MSDDFCLEHGTEFMKTVMGNPIAWCAACEQPIVGPNVSVGVFEDIPDFLRVANRVPLSPEKQAKLAKVRVAPPTDKWREREEARKQEKREKARELAAANKDRKGIEAQIEAHKQKHPDRVEQRLIQRGLLAPRKGRR